MNHYFQTVNAYATAHKKIVVGVAAGICAVAVLVILFVMIWLSNPSRVVYRPVKACDLLTPAKAQDLLGDKVIGVDTKDPVVADNMATSKCSYTDTNPDQNKMVVAAIAVRSGVNDQGVRQNKTDFAASKPAQNTEEVKGLGQSAYFNHDLGQLNILDGQRWIILSYGAGATPSANTLGQVTKLAQEVLK